MEDRAIKLAEEHWNYIDKLLELHAVEKELRDIISYHYKTAFIHGYKHAMEDINEGKAKVS